MKYLNLGCGSHYSIKREWINLDFKSTGEGVIGHNLLRGIPFEDNKFDLVYHSHVLEHFSKDDGDKFISECLRVLKPGGVIRVVIPDLEQIVKGYLQCLELGLQNPENTIFKANYDWILLEMYDQTVRNIRGGNMAKYLFQETIINEEFIFNRIGEEGKSIRNYFFTKNNIKSSNLFGDIVSSIKSVIKILLFNKSRKNLSISDVGKFRLSGEIHQWMYDRYSLANLLKSKSADKIIVRDAFTSYIPNWSSYELDGSHLVVRKPDSLFIEAIKE